METSFGKVIRVLVIIMLGFLALTTIAGGVALITDSMGMPVELLEGSPFSNYSIPGLSLAVIVGGNALIAVVLLFRKSKFSYLFSAAAGFVIMIFEFVEVQAVGTIDGLGQFLQIFYFGLGTLIVVLSMGTWFLSLRSEKGDLLRQSMQG